MNADALLKTIFDHERELRRAEQSLLESDEKELVSTLKKAVDEALKLSGAEAEVRLERLSDLCAQVAGPAMVDALIAILGHEAPTVRIAAGEAICDLGYERYAELAHGIERALDAKTQGPAMEELPWVLVEIGEASALKLIGRFLKDSDPQVVASAIESLVELGDPRAADYLEPLTNDTREAVVEDFEEETSATIGDLAAEAIEMLNHENDD